jgi:DNA-binding NarL/FixJ family response regulator
VELFRAAGAIGFADQAAAELARCGQQRKSSTELTASERQVATLVAQGASNAEVAAALFLSVKTVETHLSRVYRKVGVRSRAGLAAQWSSEDAT